MTDLILTGASRGIGRALALALAEDENPPRMLLIARDAERLASLVGTLRARGVDAQAQVGDLGGLDAARALGRTARTWVRPGALLVHNAGVWPSHRTLTEDGLEQAFVTNCAGPLTMQAELLDPPSSLARVLVIGAGLMVRGRVDAERTPTGRDFSSFRTYCDTKLAFAVAQRELARLHPELDVLVLHPGVVRTELGARGGLLGWVLERVKRRWEDPADCAARLSRLLSHEGRWSPPRSAAFRVVDRDTAWPPVAEAGATLDALPGLLAYARR